MFVAVQPNLVERVVFEAARRDATLRPHYERQFARCHEHADGPRRDQAFAELHERWFNELGYRGLILGVMNEMPHARERVDRLMVAQAPSARTQTAELFGGPGHFTVVMAVAPAELLERPGFEYWARHELLHIDDMLNPGFGYDAARRPKGATAAGRSLTQDRYAVLWALSVDARLSRRGQAAAGVRERRCAELARAFGVGDAAAAATAFDALWEQGSSDCPKHRSFLEWAEHGLPGLGPCERADRGDSPPAGGPCPLCGLPTFDWEQRREARERLSPAIQADFPNWAPDEAICGRCAEVYAAWAAERARPQDPPLPPSTTGQGDRECSRPLSTASAISSAP